LSATARDEDGHRTRTDVGFYGLGPGYTAWARNDHLRITLEPERRTWKPGETARVMIQSPWESATALLTSLAVLPARTTLKSGRVLDVDAVQAVMRAHLHDSLNLDELAAQFKLSRFHFAKTYRALTGHAPIQDFIQLKMAHACRLLDEGEQGIRQVAEQLGYEDVYYFSRLFRKVVGMAPSHYRALHQG
jgi:AraC-like DNA-binding protein